MRLTRTFLSLLALVSTAVEGRSATGQRVLVIVEHAINRADYSQFWDSLQARGFELTFKGPKEETHQLVEYGERNFDHLIMMAPSTSSFADHLRPIRLLPTLLESGINTLFLSSPSQTDATSSLYREFDLEFSPSQTSLLTHNPLPGKSGSYVAFDLEDGLHGEVPFSIIPEIVRQKGKRTSGGAGGNVGRKMVVPEGLTHTPGSNPFLIPVLHAPPGTFTGDLPRLSSSDDSSDDDYDDNTEERRTKNKLQQVVAGEEAGLVSVFQSRSNVRFGWVGSVGMVKDDVWTAETLNPEFISSLTSWIFQETGVVKVLSTEHYRIREAANGGAENGTIKETRDRFKGYTVKEDVTYEIALALHDPSSSSSSSLNTSYVPFEIDDLQLDFTMLDPHIRTSIPFAGEVITSSGERAGLYRKTFQVPDRHGVFKFVVDWWRPGYSFIHESDTTSVIPFRHDEYPRFIRGASPFYTGAGLVSGAFLVFCWLWMHLGVEGDKVGRGNVVEKEGKKTK